MENRVAKIGPGEKLEFDLRSGKHTLEAKIDWCSSPIIQFNISENDTKYFLVSCFKDYIIMASPIIYYYLTFGRKKYLKIVEEK
jgi:hypothetical protein